MTSATPPIPSFAAAARRRASPIRVASGPGSGWEGSGPSGGRTDPCFRSLARARFDRLIYFESVDDRDEASMKHDPKRRYFAHGSACPVGCDRGIGGRRTGGVGAETGNPDDAPGAIALAGRLRVSVRGSVSGRGLRGHRGPLGDVRVQLHVVRRVGVGRQPPAHRLVRPRSDERLELAKCRAPSIAASRYRPRPRDCRCLAVAGSTVRPRRVRHSRRTQPNDRRRGVQLSQARRHEHVHVRHSTVRQPDRRDVHPRTTRRTAAVVPERVAPPMTSAADGS